MIDCNDEPPRFVDGLEALADCYDGFAVDQWGVMHDGQQAYPGAVDCLRTLVERGKTVVVLTNSGKRVVPNVRRLARMGFDSDCYNAVVSSGEVTWSALDRREEAYFAGLGRRCLLFSQGGDRTVVDGLDLETVERVEDADFILLAGIDDSRSGGFYENTIHYGSMRDLPLICANPDEIRITSKGLMPSCGAIARRYQSLGGEQVRFIGKPYADIYRYSLRIFGDIPAERIVAVGDSLQHDIVGATAMGLGSAFITGGIHKHDFPETAAAEQWQRRLRTLARTHNVVPDWVIPALAW